MNLSTKVISKQNQYKFLGPSQNDKHYIYTRKTKCFMDLKNYGQVPYIPKKPQKQKYIGGRGGGETGQTNQNKCPSSYQKAHGQHYLSDLPEIPTKLGILTCAREKEIKENRKTSGGR